MRVRVHDEFGPEALAMMQALYSRSAESVDVHVDRVRERGSSKFMESYYVGYGHASIGDCGVTTLFIENVSILACKAFQNNRLYSGQETSTRYIDFAKQDIVDPLDRPEAREIQNNWLTFYLDIQAPLVASLKQRFPREADQKEKQWEKAIEARSFDIARGFLPAGITTQFSWTTNLRQAYDNLVLLKAHPLAEVREIANICLSELKTKYPSSFGHREDEAVAAYHEEAARQFSYDRPTHDIPRSDGFGYNCEIRKSDLDARCADLLRKRPAAAGLPKELSAFGSYRCQFDLDYGSFRDLQRHRNGFCAMPVLGGEIGFHDWYIGQLPGHLVEAAEHLIASQSAQIARLQDATSADAADLQYYYPLGMKVACELVYDLPQMVYVTELRSKKTVHPTLRWVAQRMGAILADEHPGMALYCDFDADDFDVRRGNHDIVMVADAALRDAG